MKRFNRMIIAAMIIIQPLVSQAQADTFTINTFDLGITEQATAILKEAYQQLGHDVVIKKLPAKRSVVMANLGLADGELIRIAGTSLEYENLIRIPVPIMTSKTIVITKKNSVFTPLKWKDLRGKKFAIPLGVKLIQDRTKGMQPEIVSIVASLFKMLERKRVDAVVLPLEMLGSASEDVRMVNPAIEVIELFHFVHKKHKNIVTDLAMIFEEMNLTSELH
jgi:polar amino acid transport system substrate-binding protein